MVKVILISIIAYTDNPHCNYEEGFYVTYWYTNVFYKITLDDIQCTCKSIIWVFVFNQEAL